MSATQHTPGPWVMDKERFVRIEDQAQMLLENIGTDHEWVCVGMNDEDGFAEVVALCHPLNAPLVSSAPELLSALRNLLKDHKRMFPEAHPNSTIKWSECVEVKQARAAIAKAKGRVS